MRGSGATADAHRTHVVLIPGFAGFDALGQLEYYAGVTPLFGRWVERQRQPGVVLHYFDNFPTAAVSTRASRLKRYLAKRIARGEFQGNDDIILVGHSTGGLDIRRLLWDLTDASAEVIKVDGGDERAAGEILNLIRRIVFLSVPQRGTNIADWVRARDVARFLVVTDLRAAVAGSQMPLLDKIESWIASGAVSLSHAGLFQAIKDVLSEADASHPGPGPERPADAREAASELELWLRHMAWDFRAIDDLTSAPTDGDTESPAHFTPERRRKELAFWRKKRIETRSYVTLGTRPFRFDKDVAPAWDMLKPWTYAESDDSSKHMDGVYRFCYRACAGGPFRRKSSAPMPAPEQIQPWDNDGIVNTASMFWPTGENVVIRCDHMDIVGHYRPEKAPAGSGRTYQRYDLLGSASEFGDKEFERLWNEIFDFCAQGAARKALTAKATRSS